MRRILGTVLIILCVMTVFTPAVFGRQHKTVFLKDGGMIDCESFWSEDGRVVVRVNRDTIVTFDRSEVDLRRTMHKRSVRTKKHTVRHAQRAVVPRPPVQKAVSSVRSPVPAGTGASGGVKASGPANVKPMPPRETAPATPQGKSGTVKPSEGNAPRSQTVPAAKPAEGGDNVPPKTAPEPAAVKPQAAKPAPAPPPPPPKEPILGLRTIALGLLLVFLVVAVVIRQRKNKGASGA